jgi:hypothetical protein
MLESPTYIPVIGVDPSNGDAIYHVGLKLKSPSDLAPEEGMAFLDPSINSLGVIQKASELLHELARKRGFKGTFMKTVTTHVMSQRGAVMYLGTSPCALLFAIASGSILPVDMPATSSRKISTIVHYYVIDRSPAKIYVPSRHAEMIAEIYQWLSLPRDFGKATDMPLPDLSELTYITDEMNSSTITLKTIGRDCVERIHTLMNALRKDGVETINLRLAAETPVAPFIVEECEKIGLSFAGVIPMILHGKDAIIMQWVGIPLDMDAIKIFGDKGRKLFAYVKKCLGY